MALEKSGQILAIHFFGIFEQILTKPPQSVTNQWSERIELVLACFLWKIMKRIEFSENKLKLTGFKRFWKINNVLIFATSNLSIEKIHSRSSFELNKLVFRFIFTHFIIKQLNWFLFFHPSYYNLVTLWWPSNFTMIL